MKITQRAETAMDEHVFDLGDLLEHQLLTRYMVAPVILRLAKTQKQWDRGEQIMEVGFRKSMRSTVRQLLVILRWDLGSIALDHGYPGVRKDLRSLKNSFNDTDITELAALGIAFALVTILLPNDRITKVVSIGGRGDYGLNGRRDEMIEISGTVQGNLTNLFNSKRSQVLMNASLRRALVSVTRFATPASRLERVK